MEIWQNIDISDLEEEIWRDIEGYEGMYMVSNKGRVKSMPRITATRVIWVQKILRQKKNGNGYVQVKLSNKSKAWMPIVSRLVATAFLEKPTYPCVANHKDCIRHHNWVENLEWISQSQNVRYAYFLGRRTQKGEKNNASKITQEIVENIRQCREDNDHLSQREIGEIYGLKREQIRDILNSKTWNYKNG